MNKVMENKKGVTASGEASLTKVEQELAVMFLATSFLKLFLEQTLDEAENRHDYDAAFTLYGKMSKICNLYTKKFNKLVDIATPILERIDDEARKLSMKKSRFEKRVRVNIENEVEVSGLVFVTALILEHKTMKGRTFHLPYQLAEDINNVYQNLDTKSVSNSRTIATKFVKALSLHR